MNGAGWIGVGGSVGAGGSASGGGGGSVSVENDGRPMDSGNIMGGNLGGDNLNGDKRGGNVWGGGGWSEESDAKPDSMTMGKDGKQSSFRN